jgi:tripartite-type tricarboxylate transporter receptor subunit TctC
MATVAIVTNKLQGLLPYDYNDFTLMGTFYKSDNCVFGSVKTQRPFRTIEEAISFAKSRPGEVSIATSSIGQASWIGAMAFMAGTGIKLNVIPQAGGGGLVVVQLAGGHAELAVIDKPAAKPLLDAGNLRFLAVLGPERAAGYKDVPTLREVGYNVTWESFGIVIGPPKMPKDVTDKLVKAFEVAANDPEYERLIFERFTMPFYLPPDRIIPYCNGQRKVARDVMEKAGILKEK